MYLLSEQVVNFMSKYDFIENKCIYQYGVQLFFSDISNFLIIIIPSLYMNKLWEGAIFLLTFITIRKYCGGYHCSTCMRCNISFFICFLLSLFSINFYNCFLDIIFICAVFLIIIKKVQINSLNKTRNNMKLKSKIIINISFSFLMLYLFVPSLLYIFKFTIVIICFLLYINRKEGV